MNKQTDEKKSGRDNGIIQKKNKTTGKLEWYARIVRVDGNGNRKQYTKKAESKSDARRKLDELAETFSERQEKGIEGDKMAFRQLADIYRETKLTEAEYHGDGDKRRKVAGVRSLKPVLTYIEVLRTHFGAKLIRSITQSDLEKFKLARLKTKTIHGKERSIADVNRTLALMRQILNFAVQNKWLKESPFGSNLISTAAENKRKRILNADEERRLLAVCTGEREHLRPLMILGIETAMRKGEILKLRWQNIDLENRLIIVLATNTKTQTARLIPMTDRVFNELSKLQAQSDKKPSDKVFDIADFKRSFATAKRLAGIEDFHFHDGRHTGASRMILAGISPMLAKEVTGHTDLKMLSRYVNADASALRQIAETMTAYQTAIDTETADEIKSDFVN
jgi:integrase